MESRIAAAICTLIFILTSSPQAAPRLANLPSAPGPHIAQIEAMGDNSWMQLPPTGIDSTCPSWGGRSYARSWTPKACYAPELGGAFITGEGAHGANSGGYYGDDVWFYDLYANQWINIYTGTHIASFGQKLADSTYTIDTNGIMHDLTGSAVPVIQLGGHGGWAMDYDKANRKFAWIGTTVGGQYQPAGILNPWVAAMTELALPWWTNGSYGGTRRHGMWTYDVATGKFDFLYHGTGAPDRYTAGDLYIDSKRKIMRPSASKEWWYDLSSNTVTSSTRHGDAPPTANTYGACYDSRRDCVYLFGPGTNLNFANAEPAADHFWIYDVAADSWSMPHPSNSPNIRIDNGRYLVQYDSISDRCLILYITQQTAAQGQRFIHAYNPNANEFEAPIPVGTARIPEGFMHAFFCPEADAYFIHQAGGDNYAGNTWVYRFKSPPTVAKEGAMTGVTLISDKIEIEQYLKTRLHHVMHGASDDTLDGFLFCALYTLDPAVASVTQEGVVTALDTGTARFALSRNGFRDTLSLRVIPSTATLDSIQVWPPAVARMIADPCTLGAVGYFHKGDEAFLRRVDTLVTWASSDDSIAAASAGGLLALVRAGGPVDITASLEGKTGLAAVTVWPRPSFIRRINFQSSATPWKFGWLADNGGLYPALSGYGWTSAPQTIRSDRLGTNYLLKTLVSTNYTSKKVIDYRVDCPDGGYIIKYGVGDNLSSTSADTVWMAGQLLFAHYGAVNGIKIDTVTVTGNSGLVLTVCGAMNYLVMISNEGIDINQVADDDGILPTPPAAVEKEPAVSGPIALTIAPNPFNPSTTIRMIGAVSREPVRLCIYDIRGGLVEEMRVPAARLAAGFTWNAARFGSGVYTLRVTAGSVRKYQTLILLK